jgi:hypothetical protein
VNSAERIKYYDNLVDENAERVLNGLSPTAEYRRLDSLIEEFMTRIEAEETGNAEEVIALQADVMDFLAAFERLFGAKLLEVN